MSCNQTHRKTVLKYALGLQGYGAPNCHTDTNAARLVLRAQPTQLRLDKLGSHESEAIKNRKIQSRTKAAYPGEVSNLITKACVAVVSLLIQLNPKPRMYLDHKGNRNGNISPS